MPRFWKSSLALSGKWETWRLAQSQNYPPFMYQKLLEPSVCYKSGTWDVARWSLLCPTSYLYILNIQP